MSHADRLRALILTSSLSTAEIARRSETNVDVLYQFLRGHTEDPRMSTIVKILGAMDLPWAALDQPGETR